MTFLGLVLLAPAIIAMLHGLTPLFAYMIGKRRLTIRLTVPHIAQAKTYVFYHEKGDELDLLLKEIYSEGS